MGSIPRDSFSFVSFFSLTHPILPSPPLRYHLTPHPILSLPLLSGTLPYSHQIEFVCLPAGHFLRTRHPADRFADCRASAIVSPYMYTGSSHSHAQRRRRQRRRRRQHGDGSGGGGSGGIGRTTSPSPVLSCIASRPRWHVEHPVCFVWETPDGSPGVGSGVATQHPPYLSTVPVCIAPGGA